MQCEVLALAVLFITEHCSVGPTKLIETTIASTTSMKVFMRMTKTDEKVYGFLNLDF